MSPASEIAFAIVTAVIPFFALGSLMWAGRRIEQRRAASLVRQVGLTDAIHRELGAAAAPVVRLGWLGGWTVAMAVPLEREDTVGAVVRIAHEFFTLLDRVDALRLRIVLTPREPRAARRAALAPASGCTAATLSRAGARLG